MKSSLTLRAAAIAGISLALVACGGTESAVVAPVSKNDKKLTCDQLQLEINDATFMRDQAVQNKSFSLKNIIWPLGYPATFSSAQEAIDASNTRIAYLSKIYGIKGCDDPYRD